jgi:hypothetical protein
MFRNPEKSAAFIYLLRTYFIMIGRSNLRKAHQHQGGASTARPIIPPIPADRGGGEESEVGTTSMIRRSSADSNWLMMSAHRQSTQTMLPFELSSIQNFRAYERVFGWSMILTLCPLANQPHE